MKRILSFGLVLIMLWQVIPMSTGSVSAETTEMDDTWYQAMLNIEETVYTITTKEELLGFSHLLAQGENFRNFTVKLGADITVNDMDLSDLSKVDTSTLLSWYDGGDQNFAGTFDGQGYTVSGLYYCSSKTYSGLFGKPSGSSASVKNLSVVNSCVVSSGTYVGSVFGYVSNCQEGITLTSLYMDVDIYAESGSVCGGLIGNRRGNSVTINSCVYAGNLTVSGEESSIGGLIGSSGGTVNVVDSAVYGVIDCDSGTVGGIIGTTTGTMDVKTSIVAATLPATFSAAFYGSASNDQNVSLTNNLYTAESIRAIPEDSNSVADSSSQYELVEKSAICGADAMSTLMLHGLDNWKAQKNDLALPMSVALQFSENSSEDASGYHTKLVGYQVSKVENGYFSIRLVAVVESVNYSAVGFRVQAEGDAIGQKSKDHRSCTVYSKLLGFDANGTQIDYTAQELGGAYIFALNINQIPANCGTIQFRASTYHVIGNDVTDDGEVITFSLDSDRIQ